ncbi:MAG: nuclear transport factor 2 family protein [Terracidiphilus sp.]
MKRRWVLPLLALMLTVTLAKAQSANDDEAAIRSAITAQAGAWNNADIDGFMQAYEDSEQTTFIGMNLRKGYKPIRQRYIETYSTPEKMGKLSFSDLDVRMIPAACGKTEIALATGRYHLVTRDSAEKTGVFSLVWRKGPHGWKIILDHTS